MSMPLWFYNVAVYCAQFAILIAAGGLIAAITGLRAPRGRLIYWQTLLALGLLLPVIEPWQTSSQIKEGMAHAVGPMTHAGTIGTGTATLPVHAVSSFPIYEIVAIVLLAGLLFRLLWLAVGVMRLQQSCRYANALGPDHAMEQFKKTLGVSPAVLISDRTSSPVTFGWRRPRILMPKKFIQMDEARQRVILCHEFLHVRRRDWLWHVAEEILRALFWFHLAVGWLIAEIRLCREQTVDREVVILAGSRRDYLEALFEITSSSHNSPHSPALLLLSERNLKRRVTLILKEVSMSRKKLILALSASLGGLLLAGVLTVTLLPLRTFAAPGSSSAATVTPLVRPDTQIYGNPDARVTVVEFGDFQCPACRKAESVAQEVRNNLGSQIRFAYRQFPLTKIHPRAERAAEVAECAGEQGKYWQAVDYLSNQPLDFRPVAIQQFALRLGVDSARLNSCLSGGEMAARVQQDVRDGRALGVTAVPTFFVNGTKIVGIPTYSQFRTLIEQHLRAGNDGQRDPSKSFTLNAGAPASRIFVPYSVNSWTVPLTAQRIRLLIPQ